MKALSLGSGKLKLEDIKEVAAFNRKVVLSISAQKKVEKSYKFLQSEINKGKTIYGVNTGFGQLANVKISNEKLKQLQYNLLRSHAVGIGPSVSESVVRSMLLLRAANLAIGHSGVSVGLIKQLLNLLNKGVHPVVPAQGSVGASGDLAPLAHLALVLIGEGKARYKGKVLTGSEALKKAGIKPYVLGAKEGLALINGTQFMSAIGVLNLLEAEYLADLADVTGAMSLEVLRGSYKPFSKEVHDVRPHPGQKLVAKRFRDILTNGGTSTISKSHERCNRVQDPYSLRCIPQVHGATRDVLSFVRGVLEVEVNSVTDNPLVFPNQKKVISAGNFHGEILAMAMDNLAIAVSELASISEIRIEKLINPDFSDLPPFLTKDGGVESGFMIVQVAAASIVSENKTLAHPASVDSIPTSVNKEDHVSMGAWGARKANRVIVNVRRVLVMELLCATQGLNFLRPLKAASYLEKIYKEVSNVVPSILHDRAFYEDIERIEKLIETDKFKSLVFSIKS